MRNLYTSTFYLHASILNVVLASSCREQLSRSDVEERVRPSVPVHIGNEKEYS